MKKLLIWLALAAACCATEMKSDSNLFHSVDVGIGAESWELRGLGLRMSSQSAHIALGWTMYLGNHAQVGASMRFGAGQMRQSGALVQNLRKNMGVGIFDYEFKAGVNVLELEVPIFVNLLAGAHRVSWDNSALDAVRGWLGVGLERVSKFGWSVGVLAVNSAYRYPHERNFVKSHTLGFGLQGALKFTHDLSSKVGLYTKLSSRFYKLPSAHEHNDGGGGHKFPKASNVDCLLEMGVRF